MTFLEAVLYGAVQGLTEYLPISSSAHLILLPRFLGHEDPGLAFDVFLHLGTLAATLGYFRRDWIEVFKPKNRFFKLKMIVMGTVPALLCGALFHKIVSTELRGNLVLMITLPLGGLLLYASDRFLKKGKLQFETASFKDAALVGVAQCFALIPGMSRSGSTMTGARLLGFTRSEAARFSFLLSAPITAAAVVFEMRHFGELMQSQVGGLALVTAGLSSFVFGFLAIGGLLKWVERFGFLSFAIYRCVLAVVIFKFLGI